LAELGLGATLTDLVTEWHRRNSDLEIVLHYDAALEQLDNKVAIHVYRIVQECLTNVVRHAQASKVNVSLALSSERVEINVVDNGIGGKTESHGFGVLGMRERVESLGGKFAFNSEKNKGVQVNAWMPFIGKKDEH